MRTAAQAFALLAAAFPRARDIVVRPGEVVAMNAAMTMHVACDVTTQFAFLVPPSSLKAINRLGEFVMTCRPDWVEVKAAVGRLKFKPLEVPPELPREGGSFDQTISIADPRAMATVSAVVDGVDLLHPVHRGVTLMPFDGSWIAVSSNGKAFASRKVGGVAPDMAFAATLPPETAKAIASVEASTLLVSNTAAKASADGVTVLSSLVIAGDAGNVASNGSSYGRFERFLRDVCPHGISFAMSEEDMQRTREAVAVAKAAGLDALTLTSTGRVVQLRAFAYRSASANDLLASFEIEASSFSSTHGLLLFSDVLGVAGDQGGLTLRVSPHCLVIDHREQGALCAVSRLSTENQNGN